MSLFLQLLCCTVFSCEERLQFSTKAVSFFDADLGFHHMNVRVDDALVVCGNRGGQGIEVKMKEIIERWSNRTSPYIFGYLTGNENETYIYNKVKKTKKRINQLLKSISEEIVGIVPKVANPSMVAETGQLAVES